ncbi:MAG: sulfite exporter TauE/SafE family protein, partial [Oscillibacter sp.]
MTWSLAMYVFVVQFFAYMIKGLVGFGNPLLSSPLMAMRMDNKLITPANLLIDLPVNAYIVLKNRKSFHIKRTLPVTGLILLGVIPGTLFLRRGSPWTIKAILGVFIIGLGVEMATRKKDAKAAAGNRLLNVGIPFLSGIMAGLFGINLLFLSYFERISTDRKEFRSSVCFVFLMENCFRAIVYGISGLFTPLAFQLAAVTVPAAVLGVLAGNLIDRKISEATANRMVVT